MNSGMGDHSRRRRRRRRLHRVEVRCAGSVRIQLAFV